ncbi:hypothetical protein PUR34_01625 [Streptomyces sp. JV185]|nr:hypothetical protein [Streptomyces sp. JV185]MEE1766945.1 hypothetical protein [Streptomyces sp. JV185]
MRDILINKADLVSEPHMPLILLEVYAHASWHESQSLLALRQPQSV